MKPSGVNWIGDVPNHWAVGKFKHAGRFQTGMDYKHLSKGDVPVFGSSETPFGRVSTAMSCGPAIAIGRKGTIDKPYLLKGAFWVVDTCMFSRITNSAYDVGYCFYVASIVPWSDYSTKTALPSLTQAQVDDIPLPTPGIDEQVRIATFLGRATTRIDGLIERKTRFIALLREKRQALITRAVTRGLNADVPMKDSGMEWLGQVPAHWAVCKLNFRYSVELGKMLDGKRNTGLNPVPYLRNQDIQWHGINADDLPTMDILPSEMERYTAVSGDLLVCEGGEVGRAAIWRNAPVGYQKALHRLRPRHHDDSEFMCLLLQAAKGAGAFDEGDTKSTISHLPAEKFRDFKFVFPPTDEQARIVCAVQKKTTRIDTLIAKTERSITLLREKRTALITAAVTGKIDLAAAA